MFQYSSTAFLETLKAITVSVILIVSYVSRSYKYVFMGLIKARKNVDLENIKTKAL
jgi:hypothetical protein